MKNNLLGIVLPTNNPDAMYKYLLNSIDNLVIAKDYVEFLINFQKPWTEEMAQDTIKKLEDKGFEVIYKFSEYKIPGPGLVPVNRIREDSARLDPSCEYYLIFDDDMTFLGPSYKMPRSSGEQIIESLVYLKTFPQCGVLVFGGTLIKRIPRDSIMRIHHDREYVTGKGLILKRIDDESLLLPKEVYNLLGSDEEKVAAGFRIANGYIVSEMPFVRINHYENQLSNRNKNGKIPGYMKWKWNTDEIKDANNFGFIREHYNKDYKSGAGNIVSTELFLANGGPSLDQEFTMLFDGGTIEGIIERLEYIIEEDK